MIENNDNISLQFGLGALASDGALNETVGVSLGSENSGVFASVLDILVPRKIWEICQ